LSFSAADAVSNGASASQEPWIDQTTPDAQLSGDLYDGRGQYLDGTSSPYLLDVEVDDRIDASTPVSGIHGPPRRSRRPTSTRPTGG